MRLEGDARVHDTTVETGFQFSRRLLLQYQMPYRVLTTPVGQVSGVGDAQVRALGVLTSDPERLLVILLGWGLDSASQPMLGLGKQQLIFGAGAAIKPRRFWLAYGVAQQTLSVAGSADRPDIAELDLLLGNILFGWQYNWIKAELAPRFDFDDGAVFLFGTFEAGALLVGRVGLFARIGTQLAGTRQIDYSLVAGLRYLFRLEGSRTRS